MNKKKNFTFVITRLGWALFIIWALTNKPNDAYAILCFKKGEQISGMNKICYYDCTGSGAAITVTAAELCPLTMEQHQLEMEDTEKLRLELQQEKQKALNKFTEKEALNRSIERLDKSKRIRVLDCSKEYKK